VKGKHTGEKKLCTQSERTKKETLCGKLKLLATEPQQLLDKIGGGIGEGWGWGSNRGPESARETPINGRRQKNPQKKTGKKKKKTIPTLVDFIEDGERIQRTQRGGGRKGRDYKQI